MAGDSHCIYGNHIYAHDISALYAYGNAGDPCNTALLWKGGGSDCWHGHIFLVPVLYHGEYHRIGSRYEPHLRNELEVGL